MSVQCLFLFIVVGGEGCELIIREREEWARKRVDWIEWRWRRRTVGKQDEEMHKSSRFQLTIEVVEYLSFSIVEPN